MELLHLIEKIETLKTELDALRPLREDHLNRLNQKIQLEWNYHSNSMEGNTLSKSETKSFLLWGVTAKGKPFRDYLEMQGHNEALKKVYEIVHNNLKITENLIKTFHQIILVKPYADSLAEVQPGHWKTLPNYLYSPTGERIDFAPPEDVPQLMNALINWLNNHLEPPKRKKGKYNLHPLLIAAGFHVRFIRIHPFGDGNGRMARLLTNLILMLCGYVPAIIKQEQRVAYYTALNTSDLDDVERLAVFLGKSVIENLEMAIKAANGQSIEEEEDFDKTLALLAQQLKAQQFETPLKSKENTKKVLDATVIPFLQFGITQLSKFDTFFLDSRKGFTVENGAFILEDNFEVKSLETISDNEINDLVLKFLWRNLKTVSGKELAISFVFSCIFNKTDYSITDTLLNEKYTLKYNEGLTETQQKAWIRKIQNHILIKIEAAVKT